MLKNKGGLKDGRFRWFGLAAQAIGALALAFGHNLQQEHPMNRSEFSVVLPHFGGVDASMVSKSGGGWWLPGFSGVAESRGLGTGLSRFGGFRGVGRAGGRCTV